MTQDTLFDPLPPVEPPSTHVDFLVGFLARWVLGDRKPTKAQREALARVARRALIAATDVRPIGSPSEGPRGAEGPGEGA